MPENRPGLTRRGMLAAGGAAILGAAGGYAIGVTRADAPSPASTASAASPAPPAASSAGETSAPRPAVIPFHGSHQAGVETEPALFQTFVGLDLRDPSRDSLEALLRLVTDDAARLTAGEPALGDTEPELAAHPDRLTVTLGLGRPLLESVRLGDRLPPQLPELPSFSTDAFEEPWSQTDLMLQVGTDNPLTLAHTVRMLTKDLSTLARVAWSQPGFRSPRPATSGGTTTRNLMGQVDGTVNPRPGTPEFDEVVWIEQGSEWYAGGTILVLRRLRMLLDTWEVLDRMTQETVMGRHIDTGAPIGGTSESDPVPLDAIDDVGLPVIARDAHVRVAHAASPREMILRRPYSYDNGMHAGASDVGLLFAAYMRDARTSFIPMQERISASDAFNRWNTTVGSAAYVLPGGVAEGGFLAEGLLT